MAKAAALEITYLDPCNLSFFCGFFFSPSNLRLLLRLSLSHNSIDRIPPRISECVHLRYINIRANKFTQFPQEVIYKIKKALPFIIFHIPSLLLLLDMIFAFYHLIV